MNADQTFALANILIQFAKWFIQQSPGKKVGPIRRKWLQIDVARIKTDIGTLKPDQLAQVNDWLKTIESII